MKTFNELPPWVQTYISDRYSNHEISGEEGYNSWPVEMKELNPDDMFDLFSKKHISHIESKHNSPELADEVDNTFLEDPDVNIERSSRNTNDEEILVANDDIQTEIEELKEDSTDLESGFEGISLNSEKYLNNDSLEAFNNEGLIDEAGLIDIDNDFLDIMGTGVGVGIPLLSAVDVYDKVKSGEIDPKNIRKYYIDNHGKRTLVYMLTGAALASGSTFLVAAGVLNLVYRNLGLLSIIKEKYKKDKEFWGDFEENKKYDDRDLWR
tara:strand:+ start:1281 stop:2078 length:798 start_codon:yes stop_codon:yes gene_type:complete